MSQQLVIAINNTADDFRWCWLEDGQPQTSAYGNLDALRNAVAGITQQVWLLLPGAKVVTRVLEYTEKEKKHLRSLLPYQLEDSVVGDIDELHFALGEAAQGKIAISYIERSWLQDVFLQLTSIGLEISRCWSAPTLLPLTLLSASRVDEIEVDLTVNDQASKGEYDVLEQSNNDAKLPNIESSSKPAKTTWVVALQEGVVNLRFNEQQGFTLPKGHFPAALSMLVNSQNLSDNLPNLVLRATTEDALESLFNLLPSNFSACVSAKVVANEWQLDFSGRAIDLCQAEFSQRLPLERWLKLWKSVGIFAVITLAVYIGVLMFHVHKLNKENLAIRQQMEMVYRTVVAHGPSDDPEKKLRIKLTGMQPKAQGGSAVNLLATILPLIASNPEVSIKVISYTADNGELNINVQARAFTAIDNLQKALEAQGFKAELLSSSAQGDVNSARLKISKP